MRLYTIAALLFAPLAYGSTADYKLSALAPQTPTPTHSTPTPVSSYSCIGLELRQAAGFAPIAAPPPDIVAPAVVQPEAAAPVPANPPAADPSAAPANPALPPAAVPPANPAVPPAPPAAVVVPPIPATTTMPLSPLVTGDDYVTTQWVETYIGAVQTWVPKTITFHFTDVSPAPLPGVGAIGMGTLTGKTGQTQTIYMMVGAAPTPAIDLKKGLAAVVAVGIAGLAV